MHIINGIGNLSNKFQMSISDSNGRNRVVFLSDIKTTISDYWVSMLLKIKKEGTRMTTSKSSEAQKIMDGYRDKVFLRVYVQ